MRNGYTYVVNYQMYNVTYQVAKYTENYVLQMFLVKLN